MVDVFHGMFAANAASGNQTITGVGFSGKVFLFYTVNQTNKDGSFSGHYRLGIGFADGVTKESHATTMNSSDIVTNSDVGFYHTTSGCVAVCTASGTIGINAYLSAVDGNSFTLTWSHQLAALAISGWVGYDVLGGEDVVNQKIVTVRGVISTGPNSVSGVGFSGNLALVISGPPTNTTGDIAHSTCLGMATDSSHEAVITVMSEDARANADTWRHARTDNFIVQLDDTGATRSRAQFVDFHSDGITIDWSNASDLTTFPHSLLVVKISGNVNVTSFNTISGTGNQTITGVGFSGKYVLLMSTDTASDNSTTILSNNRISIGSATDSTHRGSIWAGDQDGAATMVNTRGTRDNACFLAAIENNTDNLTSGTMIADFTSFNGNGFSINKSVNAFNGDTSGMTISSLVIGDTISGAAAEAVDITRRAFAGGPSLPTFGGKVFINQETDIRPIFGPMYGQVQVSGQLLW